MNLLFFLFQVKSLDANRYATKKTIAQGLYYYFFIHRLIYFLINLLICLFNYLINYLLIDLFCLLINPFVHLFINLFLLFNFFNLGMLDIALLTANASQLKYILQVMIKILKNKSLIKIN